MSVVYASDEGRDLAFSRAPFGRRIPRLVCLALIGLSDHLRVCGRIAGARGHADGPESRSAPSADSAPAAPAASTPSAASSSCADVSAPAASASGAAREGVEAKGRGQASAPAAEAPAPEAPAPEACDGRQSNPGAPAGTTGPLGGRRPVARAGRREPHDLAAVCAPVLPRAHDRRLGARGRARSRASAGLTATPPRCR